MQTAVDGNIPILGNGDNTDVMDSKKDPRREVMAMRDELRQVAQRQWIETGGDPDHYIPIGAIPYLDAVELEFAEAHAPFGRHMVMLGDGNHETAMNRHNDIDIGERCAAHIRRLAPGSRLARGGYSGWVKFKFTIHGSQMSLLLHYYHGCGTGGQVSNGEILLARLFEYNPMADIIWVGHIHEEKASTRTAWRVSPTLKGGPKSWERLGIITPGYKTRGDGHEGFLTQKGSNKPKPVGAAWLDFQWFTTGEGGRKVVPVWRTAR